MIFILHFLEVFSFDWLFSGWGGVVIGGRFLFVLFGFFWGVFSLKHQMR